MHARTEETTFFCKDDKCKGLHVSGSGSKESKAQSFVQKMQSFNYSYIDEAPMALDIFRFAVFFDIVVFSCGK